MTDPIKAKIRELCPDAGNFPNCPCETPGCWNYLRGRNDAPITLAIVLRAIEYSYMARGITKAFLSSGQLWTVYGLWNLEKDSWDSQSQETKDFIGTLLGVK